MRRFISKDATIHAWSDVESYYTDLLQRSISSVEDYQKWLEDRSELDAFLEENLAWRYIRMTVDARNEDYSKAYSQFVMEIQPKIAPLEDQLNEKCVSTPFFEQYQEEGYDIYKRSLKTALELFREENIELEAQINDLAKGFGEISGSQSIIWEGKELTMQQAANLLKDLDANVRKEAFDKISERRSKDVNSLNDLFNQLVHLRHQVATNCGFDNFRDYKFKALGRFDYGVSDCRDFHKSIKKVVVPLAKKIQQKKLTILNQDKFKPWDTEVDPEGKKALKPFETGAELLAGTKRILHKVKPKYATFIGEMESLGHFDLESKPGKAPGGYNYPLYESGYPFIFMNASGAQRDLETMVHECGHAIHSVVSKDLRLTGYKNVPSELAELASMSMELLTMDFWDEFYNQEDLNRAKKEQLEGIIKVLPWIGTIDEFQHWIYENPNHSIEQRTEKWLSLAKEYGTGLTDWSGYEDVLANNWQRQMHLFEVPFYYIEYGFAQLGALQVWKNSQANFEHAIEQYENALKLGYTQSIPELYKEAGIVFDFSEKIIQELMDFVQDELNKL